MLDPNWKEENASSSTYVRLHLREKETQEEKPLTAAVCKVKHTLYISRTEVCDFHLSGQALLRRLAGSDVTSECNGVFLDKAYLKWAIESSLEPSGARAENEAVNFPSPNPTEDFGVGKIARI